MVVGGGRKMTEDDRRRVTAAELVLVGRRAGTETLFEVPLKFTFLYFLSVLNSLYFELQRLNVVLKEKNDLVLVVHRIVFENTG